MNTLNVSNTTANDTFNVSRSIDLSGKKPATIELFSKFAEDQREKVAGYISLFLESYGRLIPLRYDVGRALYEIQQTAAVDKELFPAVCRALSISLKTAGRYINQFQEVDKVHSFIRQVALNRGFDLCDRDHKKLRERLAEATRNSLGTTLNTKLASAIFESTVSDLEAEEAKKALEDAESRRVHAENEKAARKAALENARNGDEEEADSTSEAEEHEEDEQFDDQELDLAPTKALNLYLKEAIAKGKTQAEILQAVSAAYNRVSSRAALRTVLPE